MGPRDPGLSLSRALLPLLHATEFYIIITMSNDLS